MNAIRQLLSVVVAASLGASICRAADAQEILRLAGTQGGLIVHVGCGDGKLTAALRANDRCLVQGLEISPAQVELARDNIRASGKYGPVSAIIWDGKRLPFADNLANLILVSGGNTVERGELLRALAPNGVVLFDNPKVKLQDSKLVKPWPAEIDQWTHWLHGPDGNAVAHDHVAGPPRGMQWIAGPLWSRHHNAVPSITAQVTANGRLFYLVDEAPASMDNTAPDKWALVARDAFNGVWLWRKPMADWGWKAWSADWTRRFTIPAQIASRLVAVGDRVFVTLGFNAPVSELDAATGEVRRTFAGSEFADEIVCDEGKLILVLNQQAQHPGVLTVAETKGKPNRDPKEPPQPPPVHKSVAAYDLSSGRQLWKTGDYTGLRSKTGSMDRINHLSLVTGGGAAFFADEHQLICLSLADGRERWRAPRPVVPEHKMRYSIRITDMCTLVYHEGVFFFAQLNPDREIDWREIRGKLHAYDARSGQPLWERTCASWGWGDAPDVFCRDGKVWVYDFQNPFLLGLDLRTGAEKQKLSCFKAFDDGHHHRCYRNKATDRFVMTSYRGYEFTDWQTGETSLNHWVRGTCRIGGFPCNGLIYANPHPCECYIASKLNGMMALSPAQAPAPEVAANERLQRGSAAGANLKMETANPDDWPIFRHDAQRSGSTSGKLGADWKKAWETPLDGPLTACTAAGGKVFTACPAAHQVYAVEAETGKVAWRFFAGAPVDSPPTVSGGCLYFGSADGWVYSLRANDGALVWKFLAAPSSRQILAMDRLESAWPVHGSVLVQDNIAYVAAGRSSYLDGGFAAYTLDARTGQVLSQRRVVSDYNVRVKRVKGQQKARPVSAVLGNDNEAAAPADGDNLELLSDVLLVSGNTAYMRQFPLFALNDQAGGAKQNAARLEPRTGFFDDSWFSRTRWHFGTKIDGEYLVFDDRQVFGIRARASKTDDGGFFTPASKGFELFCAGRQAAQAAPAAKKKSGKAANHTGQLWSTQLPVRVISMVAAGNVLLLSGTPDAIDSQEPWAAYEGRRGGMLLAIDKTNGRILQQLKLEHAPAYDGMALAAGRLYVPTQQGRLLCFK